MFWQKQSFLSYLIKISLPFIKLQYLKCNCSPVWTHKFHCYMEAVQVYNWQHSLPPQDIHISGNNIISSLHLMIGIQNMTWSSYFVQFLYFDGYYKYLFLAFIRTEAKSKLTTAAFWLVWSFHSTWDCTGMRSFKYQAHKCLKWYTTCVRDSPSVLYTFLREYIWNMEKNKRIKP